MKYVWRSAEAVTVLLVGCGLAVAQPAPPAPTAVTFEYAVKFVCGTSKGPAVAPGNYFTMVNVHAPSGVDFRSKVAIALDHHDPSTISPFTGDGLKADEAIAFDCRHIWRLAHKSSSQFLDGFLVIQSYNYELDVVAVLTAAGANSQVETVETERVPARRLPRQ